MASDNAKRLYLLDGSAVAYRSYFAFSGNPLTTRRGLPTSATYGFTTTLLRILDRERPDYFAVVFDSPEATFRHKQYSAYKATREKMPEEMADQLPYIRKVVEALRIPFLVLPGYEADDVIGTLTKRASKRQPSLDVFLISGDKDFFQLLGPRVRILNLKKGGDVEVLTETASRDRFGVPSNRIIDLLALTGDTSDNVPGVPGIGEKTAAKLIQQFGSFSEIYERLNDVTPLKLRDKLATHKEQAELSRSLVTIDVDAPILIDLESLKLASPDLPALRSLYEELEFESLLEALPEGGLTTTGCGNEKYISITTQAELESLVDTLKRAGEFVIDTETTSLNVVDSEPIALSFSVRECEAFFVPLHGAALPREQILDLLRPVLEDACIRKGGQNIKFDRAALRNAGIKLQGIVFDTLVESYLLDPDFRQHNLDALARRHLNIKKISTVDLIGKGKEQISMMDVAPEKLSHYACEDADVTLRLHRLFEPHIKQQELKKLYDEVEIPLIEVLGDMERNGIAVDGARLSLLAKNLSVRLAELEAGIQDLAGGAFNLNSPKQLGVILFEKLRIQDESGVRRIKKTKTGYATDQETLEQYDGVKIVTLLMEYRNLSKLASTYLETLPLLLHPKTKRIHTSFNQTVTATGRLSSSDPNLQNIPIRTNLGKEIRKAFIAGETNWKILSADYSQIELRILAHLSEDQTLIDTFLRKEDVHRRTASLVFHVKSDDVSGELRSRAKAINFGVIYGMGSQRLARETGISLSEAQEFIRAYFEAHPGVRTYLDRQITLARELGYVTTLLGRRRRIPDIFSSNPRLVANAERMATNAPIQGSAADIIKVAMVRIHRRMKEHQLKSRMLLQIHDELVFESPPNEVETLETLVRSEMEGAIQLKVPIVVDVGIGDSWADAH